jgi:hypothetical protein
VDQRNESGSGKHAEQQDAYQNAPIMPPAHSLNKKHAAKSTKYNQLA